MTRTMEPLPGRRRRHPVVQLPVLLCAEARLVAFVRARQRAARLRRGAGGHPTTCAVVRPVRSPRSTTRALTRARTPGWSPSPTEAPSGCVTSSTPPVSSPIPKRPEIAGLDDFGGETLHTARWDENVGPPAADVSPSSGRERRRFRSSRRSPTEVEHLTVFQRTPIWCLPRGDVALPLGAAVGAQARARHQAGHARRQPRCSWSWRSPWWPTSIGRCTVTNLLRAGGARVPTAAGEGPGAAERGSRPSYPLGCKRPSFHNSYLSTYNRDDVTLEDNPIERITAEGVTTASGTHHQADVLIAPPPASRCTRRATSRSTRSPAGGARTSRPGGTSIATRAYHGISVPGFPNYFFMLGPYGWNGSSYFTPPSRTRLATSCAA